jgi:hypothetical protein
MIIMAIGGEGFPAGSTPEERQRIKADALELIRRDAALDDSIYTPPGALGGYVTRQTSEHDSVTTDETSIGFGQIGDDEYFGH